MQVLRSRFRRVFSAGTVLGLVLGAVVVGGAAFASHQFSDVPTSDAYHGDIDWLFDNNITNGCAAGKFCPNDPVIRKHMARFLHRLVKVTRTGHFSCAGDSFVNDDDAADYATAGSLRYRIAGSTVFRCNAVLPQDAVVTAVTFAVKDSDGAAEAGGGELWRTNLTTAAGVIGAETKMADTGATGVAATPGATTLTDTTITSATVDNSKYAYFLLAFVGGTSSSVGLYGATIKYTYKGVPAP